MNERIDRGLELLVVWTVITSAIGLVSTLAGHFLPQQVLLASLLLVGIYAWRTRGKEAALGRSADWRHLLLLSLVCLFFRLPAYHYVIGGQDEGVYVNVSHYIERTGGIDVHDEALGRLAGSKFADTYLNDNRTDANFLPGIYALDPASNRLEFQFYHLFSIWMALFAGIFGSTFGIYALSFFAWLSIIFFYRLTLAVSGSKRVALVAGLLLALNPLHAFFSKFPVTEVPTLAFSLIGFTYLAAFWNLGSPVRSYRWLWISAACFGALFVTRITGFMYVPFFVALAVAGTISDPDRLRRNAMSFWTLGVVVLYILSVLYGIHWSGQYSAAIYDLSFERLFHDSWPIGVAVSASIAALCWLVLTLLARSEDKRVWMSRYLVEPTRHLIAVIVVVGLAIGLFQIYRLGWTKHFDNDDWFGIRWRLAHSGSVALKSSSLFALIVYLGPLIPAFFLVFVLRRQPDPRIEFLRLFVAGIFVYIVTLNWNIAYGPYYARYLLSELLPFMILLVVLTWSGMSSDSWKWIIKSALVLSLVYMGFASTCQLGKSENKGLYGSLKHLLSPVDSGDLVLIEEAQSGYPTADEVKTSILYTFGLNAVSVVNSSLVNRDYLAELDARYDEIFLISPSAMLPSGFASVGTTRIQDWAYQWSYLYPRRLVLRGDKRLYLSRLSRPIFPYSQEQGFDSTGRWNNWLNSGWGDPEVWGTWSVGNYAELAIDPLQLPMSKLGLRLHFDARVFVTASAPHQRIFVYLNDEAKGTYEVSYPDSTGSFDVDVPFKDLLSARKIRIGFKLPDATAPGFNGSDPNAVGAGFDHRMLALGLISMMATPLGVSDPLPPAEHSRLPNEDTH